MAQVLILVEGQTEERFIKQVLMPYLQLKGVFITPVIIKSKRTKQGTSFKGGLSSYTIFKKEIELGLTRDKSSLFQPTVVNFVATDTIARRLLCNKFPLSAARTAAAMPVL